MRPESEIIEIGPVPESATIFTISSIGEYGIIFLIDMVYQLLASYWSDEWIISGPTSLSIEHS
jgi:hypothetical protein